MLRRLFTLLVAVVLALPTAALAHENHKLMGTVTMAATDHMMMKTTDGKEVTISVTPTTKIVRGKTAVRITEIKEGTRVVATVSTHKPPFTASHIAVGTPTTTAKK